MNKKMISLAAATFLFCSPLAFAVTADSTTTAPQPMSTDSTTSTTVTEPATTGQMIQLKTSDGKMINATVNPQDLAGVKDGDMVTITGLTGTTGSTAPTTMNGSTTTSPNP